MEYMIVRIRPHISFQEVLHALMSSRGHSIVDKFELNFSEYIGTEYAIATNSARLALLIILKSIGVRKGDEVILPSFICNVILDPILQLGAVPVLVDSVPETYNINPDEVNEAISKKTKVIFPAHLYGQPCEMDSIIDIAEDSNMFVIEDCAQALGAEYKGKKVGSLSNAGIFSFDFDKNITTGGGGMITTNEDRLYSSMVKTIKNLNCQIAPPWYEYKSLLKLYNDYIVTNKHLYTYSRRPMIYIARLNRRFLMSDEQNKLQKNPYLMGPIRATIGLSQLRKIDWLNDIRINNAKLLSKYLKKCSYLKLPTVSKNVKHVFLRYNTIVDENYGIDRNEVYTHMISKGFEIVPWVFSPPVHLIHPYNQLCRYSKDRLKKTEKISYNLLNFPTHPHLTQADIQKLGNLCFDFIQNQ